MSSSARSGDALISNACEEAAPPGDPPPRDPWGRVLHVFGVTPRPLWSAREGQTDAEILSCLAEAEALTTQLMAVQSALLHTLRERRLAAQSSARDHPPEACARGCCDSDGWVTLEVAQALALTERATERRLDTADRLHRYAEVAAAVADGLLQAWTATKLLEHLDLLAPLVTPERLAVIERDSLAWLMDRPRTVSQLNARMRRMLLSLQPDGRPRSRRAADRAVHVLPGDGTDLATVVARLPDADAASVASSVRALAAEPVCAADQRTPDQREADLLTSCLTGLRACGGFDDDLDLIARAPGTASVTLDVTIPADSLAGGDAPATIPGYGTVPAQTARDLAQHDATTVQARPLVYDPTSGRLLGSGTPSGRMAWVEAVAASTAYEHPPAMERVVRHRDATCRAPGCRRRARSCDCDHVVAYPAGPTSVDNTCCLCRRHHRLKTHAPGWGLAMAADGTATWTTPSGGRLQTSPADYRPAQDRPPF